jgi:anion-transporting  ArsA/GET3 family ATPase
VAAPLALESRRLVVVTGKGGVGKSTVAAALARAAAAAGRRVLAVDVADAGVAGILGGGGARPAEPVSLAPGLAVATVDAPSALRDVVHGMMPLAVLARRLLESTTFQLVAAAAPGLPEYLVLAKIADWLEATRLGRRRWDLVVVDAPASGHSLPLLTAPRTLATFARIGTAGRTLARIDAMLADPADTALWLVTLPEELPIRETIALWDALADEAGLPVAPPIVNAMPRRRFTAADARVIESPAVDGAHPMIRAARTEIARRRGAVAQVQLLRGVVGAAPVTLPYQPADPSTDDLATLARALGRATGLAP